MANTPHDHVHRLIRSMSRAEKRYFKLYTSRHVVAGHSNHRTLFDAIAAMDTYDEAALLKRFAGEAFTHRFPITKRRLYEAILASLDAFHTENDPDARLRRMLHQADLLYARTLYADAARMLRSARQLARQLDRQTVLLDVLERERRMVERANYTGNAAEEVERIAMDAASLREEIDQVEQLWTLKSRSFMLLYREGHARGEAQAQALRSLLSHPLLQDPGRLRTAKARFLHHHVRSVVAFALGDLATCEAHLAINHELLRDAEELFHNEPNLLYGVLSNRIYVLSRLGRTAESETLLKEFKMLPATLPQAPTPDLEVKVFATGASLELAMLTRAGAFSKAVAKAPAIEERMQQYDAQLGTLRRAALHFQLAYAHLGAGQADKALRHSHRQLSEGSVDEGTEVYRFGLLLNLLILLDLGKKDLVAGAVRNAVRLLAGRGEDLPVEQAILRMAQERAKARGPEADRDALERLREALTPLLQGPHEHAVHDHFDPLAWVEARLSGRPLEEVVSARARASRPGEERKGRRAA
ncbi:MAG: hypothetical protein JNL05_09605 [Flavobacteriales bacterium]|nr:hypothetical protein [Flavobacteriales bacterium]